MNATSGIRLGLIGYGNWARNAYVPAFERCGRVAIVAAAARTENTRQRIRDELGANILVFDSAQSLLSELPLDAVAISVPDQVHEETLLAALDSDVAVFYEPPVTDTRARVRPVLQRLVAARQITHADLEVAYIPAVARSAQMIKSGTIGQPRTACIRLQCNWGPWANSDLCTVDHLTPWYVNVLNRMLDALPERVLVLDGHGTSGRSQNQSIGVFDYGDVWGMFQINIASVIDLETTIEVNGDDGDLITNVFTGEIRLRSRKSSDWSVEQVGFIQPKAGWPGMHECVWAFLDAVESSKPSLMNATTVAQLHLVGLAAESAKDSGTWSEIEQFGS